MLAVALTGGLAGVAPLVGGSHGRGLSWMENLSAEQLVDALRDWRRMLRITTVSFSRSLRHVPCKIAASSLCALRGSEQLSWLGAALSRELEMPADALCFDYAQDTFSNTFHVTAAQNKEVETLLSAGENATFATGDDYPGCRRAG